MTQAPSIPRTVRRTLLVSGLFISLNLTTALAHDFWLQPQRFRLEPGAQTRMSLQVGHGADRQKSMISAARVIRFEGLTATGATDLRADFKRTDINTDTSLSFPTQGLRVLAFQTDNASSELPADKFNAYLKTEGLTPAIDWRKTSGTETMAGRELYSRNAKTFIQIGNYTSGDDIIATKPVGLPLEIIPQTNPYAPSFNGRMVFKVNYLGKALAGASVRMNSLDFDTHPLQSSVTDAKGQVSFTVPKTGSWQMNVVWTRPVTDNPKAEFETIFSSLTFGY